MNLLDLLLALPHLVSHVVMFLLMHLFVLELLSHVVGYQEVLSRWQLHGLFDIVVETISWMGWKVVDVLELHLLSLINI